MSLNLNKLRALAVVVATFGIAVFPTASASAAAINYCTDGLNFTQRNKIGFIQADGSSYPNAYLYAYTVNNNTNTNPRYCGDSLHTGADASRAYWTTVEYQYKPAGGAWGAWTQSASSGTTTSAYGFTAHNAGDCVRLRGRIIPNGTTLYSSNYSGGGYQMCL